MMKSPFFIRLYQASSGMPANELDTPLVKIGFTHYPLIKITMKKHQLVLALILSLTIAQAQAAGGHGHWSYEGKEGPAHWGDLSE